MSQPSTMRRQSLVAYGQPLSPTERAAPMPTGSEALIRTTHCGVCHSDIHLQEGHFDLGGGKHLDIKSGRPLPFTLGHEIAGTLEAVGPAAKGVTLGTRYAVYPWIGCHKCGLCQRGDEHLCATPRALGVALDGGFASHVLVPDAKYLLDIAGIPLELAGSYMCSGLTAYGALKKALRHEHARALDGWEARQGDRDLVPQRTERLGERGDDLGRVGPTHHRRELAADEQDVHGAGV